MQRQERKPHWAAFLAASMFLLPACALAGVSGSKHDLSTGGGGLWASTDEDQVCVFCHTPHNSDSRGPLWNHEIRAGATFDLYDSDTLQAVPQQPQSNSLLCLSCHDGVTALNAVMNPSPTTPAMDSFADQLGDVYYPGGFGTYPGPNIGGSWPANPNVNDLSDDHPVSFTFDAGLIAADGGTGLKLPPGGDPVKLFGPGNDQLECASCHDVHDPTFVPFLVKSNSSSDLCLTCHIK